MHVASNTTRRANKSGAGVEYQSALICRTFRKGGKVNNETLGNGSYLPRHAIEDLQVSLKDKAMVDMTGL